jgi:hypothetical protein
MVIMMMLIEFLFGNQLRLIDSDLSPQTSHPAVWTSLILLLIKPGPSELKTATGLEVTERLNATWRCDSTAYFTLVYVILGRMSSLL